MKRVTILVVILSLVLPAVGLMLRYGIFTMHDPHLFRIHEFNQCIKDYQIPCRWSANSAKGFGVPLFNFYTQLPYLFVQIFIFTKFSILDSAKIVYSLSLILSGVTMYIYASKKWGKWGGLISSIFYVYAPYRSVDIWVRGALPESLAFVLFPIILHLTDQIIETKNQKAVIWFSLALSTLINIHNLSFLMFLPFLGIYWLYISATKKDYSHLLLFVYAGILSIGLSAFYLLPVVLEKNLITLADTISGYYNYKIHFTTLNELFISRYWGYGASLWAKKYLSVSVGHLHWTLPVSIFIGWLLKTRKDKNFIIFFLLSLFAIFLTHGKSSFIWNTFDSMKYIQFPWRFLSISALFTSISAGFISKITSKKNIYILIILFVILFNIDYFRPDIWRPIGDREQFSGELWDEGRSSSLTDFWPKYGRSAPLEFATKSILVNSGNGSGNLLRQSSNSSVYNITIYSSESEIVLPQVFFPGWVVEVDGNLYPISVDNNLGQIKINLREGNHIVITRFNNTLPRTIGNIVSIITLGFLIICLRKK